MVHSKQEVIGNHNAGGVGSTSQVLFQEIIQEPRPERILQRTTQPLKWRGNISGGGNSTYEFLSSNYI